MFGSRTCLSDEDSGERMNVHLVYSALPLDERSQCIVKPAGSLPGKVRERPGFPDDTYELSCIFK